jgi:hypothetical protein
MKHVIPTEQSETFTENPNMFQSPRNTEIWIKDNPTRYESLVTFSIFGWNEHTAARVEYQGPDVQGPYASMSKNAVVITAHKQEPKQRFEVSLDDTLEIDGREYGIRMDRYGYVKLELLG